MDLQLAIVPATGGRIERKREVAGNLLSELVCPTGVTWTSHWHANATFNLILHGRSTERYGTQVREFLPLAASYMPPEHQHSVTFHSEPMRCFTIYISNEWIRRARECSLVTDVWAHFHNDRVTQTIARLYYEFMEVDDASALAIEGLLFELLAVSSRYHISHREWLVPKWLKKARDLLHANFQDKLSLTGVAEEVGVHPVHLARGFRKYYRSSPGEYLRQIRVDYASQQLLMSDEPHAMIAAAAGFADQSHFSRTFKRLRGTTPQKFRVAFKRSESEKRKC